jgi:glucosylceramidase
MKHYRTAKYSGERISAVTEPAPTAVTALVSADPRHRYQKILGFGGAFTEASAYNLSRVDVSVREKALRAYFDPETGLGYNLGRVSIHSCDFSLGNYTYVDENDFELQSFSIARDRWLVIPMIREALALAQEEAYIVASPWSPPGWMKDTGKMNYGGRLRKECRAVWADYYTRFIRAYEEAGVPIWGLTVQNEPASVQRWESCLYSKEEEHDFVRDYLGPALVKAGYGDKKLLIWDHNRDFLVERITAILSDPDAARFVWGIAFHWYVSEDFAQVGEAHRLFPDKHLLFTEGCQEGPPRIGAWETGERYGRNLIGDFNNYNEGFIDWNLFLDETGGPNHVNNLCDAPMIIKVGPEEIVYQSSYYYIGHFSRFVRRGAMRIASSADDDRLLTCAFVNPDGSVVLVIMNQSEDDIAVKYEVGDLTTGIVVKRRSISTLVI